MSDPDGPETAEAPDTLRADFARIGIRLKGWLGRRSRWLRHKDLLAVGIVIVLSGVLAVAGVAHVALPWLFAVAGAIAAVAAFATRALEATKNKDKVRNLWLALVIASLVPVVAFLYHELWDPSRIPPSNYRVIVNGTEDLVVYPSDEPGGPPGYVYKGLIAGVSITLDCYVVLPGDVIWYHVRSNGGWIQRAAVHAIPGVSFPKPPHCN